VLGAACPQRFPSGTSEGRKLTDPGLPWKIATKMEIGGYLDVCVVDFWHFLKFS